MAARVHVNLYLNFGRAYPQKWLTCWKKENSGSDGIIFAVRKWKLIVVNWEFFYGQKMVVNWYLAEKMVVNWEMGTPIKTLMKGWCVHSSSAVWGNVNDSVPDPDLEIRGRGRSSRPFDKVGGQKRFFSALQASVWSKSKGRPGPRGPLPWIRHYKQFRTASTTSGWKS